MSKIWFPGEDKLHQASTQEEMGSWNDEPLTALELEMMVCDFVSAAILVEVSVADSQAFFPGAD
jgi:hypothetical protein